MRSVRRRSRPDEATRRPLRLWTTRSGHGPAYRRPELIASNATPREKHEQEHAQVHYLLQKCFPTTSRRLSGPEDASSRSRTESRVSSGSCPTFKLMFPDTCRATLQRCQRHEPRLLRKVEGACGAARACKADGDKVLLFSTNLRFAPIRSSSSWLAKVHSFLRLDGTTPQPRRQQLVNQFNRDSSILAFSSPPRQAHRLNLTAATRVVVFDPHWNPSHDLQAMDRAYRSDKSRDVYVYRLIGAGSLEEVISGDSCTNSSR